MQEPSHKDRIGPKVPLLINLVDGTTVRKLQAPAALEGERDNVIAMGQQAAGACMVIRFGSWGQLNRFGIPIKWIAHHAIKKIIVEAD